MKGVIFRKMIFKFIGIVFIALFWMFPTVNTVGVNTNPQGDEGKAWLEAVKQDTIAAYYEYVDKFPNSPRMKELKERIDAYILRRVAQEVKDRKAEIKIGTKSIPIRGLVPGATITLGGGEVKFIREDITFLSDPTDKLKIEGGIGCFWITKGRGAIIIGDDNVVHVYGVDVSGIGHK